MHTVAGVRLVGAVRVHGVPVIDATQRRGELDAHMGEGVLEHVLECTHDVVLVHEAHLDVHLRELGLAVGAQVLIAEALGNLVVALHATDHEQLLEQLGALRQGVEVTRLDAAGNDEVARTLGRGLEQARRLDLGEQTVVKGPANGEREVRAQLKLGGELRTTNVQIAVAQTRVLGRLDAVLDLEGRRLRGVQNLDAVHANLNLAGGELGVHGLLIAATHHAVDQDGPLGADGLGGVKSSAAGVLRVEGALRHARAVAQVDENQATVIATTPHPASEGHLLADVLGAQLSCGMGVHGKGIGHRASSICAAPCSYGRLTYRRRTGIDSASAHCSVFYNSTCASPN